MMKILKDFAVFEGCDGSGTTTQLEILEKKFRASPSLPVLYRTFEPTDGPVGRLIRQGLANEIPLKCETIAFLFAADRNEHVYGPGGIMEHTGRNELVVCDRYIFSSLVYQGITCGEELPERLNRDFPLPELILYFDLDPETAVKRLDKRSLKEIYETLEFQTRVRERYRTLLSGYPETCKVETIDASRTVEEVSCDVWRALQKMPIFKV